MRYPSLCGRPINQAPGVGVGSMTMIINELKIASRGDLLERAVCVSFIAKIDILTRWPPLPNGRRPFARVRCGLGCMCEYGVSFAINSIARSIECTLGYTLCKLLMANSKASR